MGFVLFIHIAVSILLAVSILMQAGKGGGLAESFASAESMFGTQTNTFMVRLSTILATIFLVTSLVLAVHGAKGEKSLMANKQMVSQVKPLPKPAEPEITVNVSSPKAAEDLTKTVVNAATK